MLYKLDWVKIIISGKHESSLGTYMFFEEDPSPQCADPIFDKLPEKSLKFVCKTRKHLNMEHAYVTPKEGKGKKLIPFNMTCVYSSFNRLLVKVCSSVCL